jgi:hypothetical protein
MCSAGRNASPEADGSLPEPPMKSNADEHNDGIVSTQSKATSRKSSGEKFTEMLEYGVELLGRTTRISTYI